MKTLLETAAEAGTFKTLLSAVKAAGLTDALNGAGPFTVFAPTDEAFAKVPKADLDALFADKAKFADLLKHHVVAGKVSSKDLSAAKDVKTLQGAALKLGSAKVTKADVEASNGTIHVIDSVLSA